MTLAAARQAAAIGGYGDKPAVTDPPRQASTAAQPVTPAKPPGMGLLVDKRI